MNKSSLLGKEWIFKKFDNNEVNFTNIYYLCKFHQLNLHITSHWGTKINKDTRS